MSGAHPRPASSTGPQPRPPALLPAGRPGLVVSPTVFPPTFRAPASSAWQAPCVSDAPRDPRRRNSHPLGIENPETWSACWPLVQLLHLSDPHGPGAGSHNPGGRTPLDRLAMSQPTPAGPHLTPVLLAGGWVGGWVGRGAPAFRCGALPGGQAASDSCLL